MIFSLTHDNEDNNDFDDEEFEKKKIKRMNINYSNQLHLISMNIYCKRK